MDVDQLLGRTQSSMCFIDSMSMFVYGLNKPLVCFSSAGM